MSARPPRPIELPWLRPIPGDTPIHRLWAGTKLLAVIGFGLALSINPTWAAIGIVTAVVVVAIGIARIPRGARPRLPRLLWLLFLVGALLALKGGGSPSVHAGSLTIELGGLDAWCRVLAIPVVLLAAGAMLTWTTPLGEIAPALSVLFGPLRRLRVPVDTWAAGVALSLRCFPTLVDEMRTLIAARRLRPKPAGVSWRHRLAGPHDLLSAALLVSFRRAADIGLAIEARGGTGTIADAPSGPRPRDAIVIVLLVAVTAAAIVV
ncbi:MAG TPA: energy-coupling factor transporter transmembrane protein EcfT [Acidimicrobiales bacterium]|jgi:energy-coupling factor transport system permease protein|nr:energy-coupling factor transporter transmembrane protein EcfT [Acidimicrobiales bacterium]